MNRKQLFIIIGVLLGLCLCVVCLGGAAMTYMGKNISQSINNAGDPANVQKIASSIADYTPPAGYKQMAMDLFMYKYVILTPDTLGNPFIMLMSFPSNSGQTDQQMQEQMQKSFSQQTGQSASMKVVDTRTISIRGTDEKVTVMEGKTANGQTLRQWLTIFQGKSGSVMLMIQGYTDQWDDKLVNDFIASIK